MMSDRPIIIAKKGNIAVVDEMPSDMATGDVVWVFSPGGYRRGVSYLVWYQRAWIAIDSKIRRWLKIY